MEHAEPNIDELVKRLDAFAASDQGRMKITVSDDVPEGEVKKQYHLGRCDIGSPWAKGCSFDVIEEKKGE